MKDIGYGAGYAYDHDAEDGFSGQDYFPEGMKRPVWYLPPERGFERELKKRVDYFAKLRDKRRADEGRSFCENRRRVSPTIGRRRLTWRVRAEEARMFGTVLQVALGGAIGSRRPAT